jgi:hypothetical protein
VRTRDELERALHALGWELIDAPTRTAGGWKATIRCGTAAKVATGSTAIGVLEDLLRLVEAHAAKESHP